MIFFYILPDPIYNAQMFWENIMSVYIIIHPILSCFEILAINKLATITF